MAGIGEGIPDALLLQLMPAPELENSVLAVVEPGMDGDPLNPRFQIRRPFFRLGDVHLRFVVEALEVGQFTVGDELLGQDRAELVELDEDDRTARGFGPKQGPGCSRWILAPSG